VGGIAVQVLGGCTVGRSGEIDVLQRALDRLANDPQGVQVVEVDGDPGIGKTRLLDELGDRTRRLGGRPLVACATEYERHVPFGMFAAVFEEVARDGGLDDETRAALDVVLGVPDVAAVPGTTGVERYRLHRLLTRSLAGASRSPGSVIVLDDCHWADVASLELIEHLLKDPPRPGIVALAYRTGQAPPRLVAALARGRWPVARLSLGPLSRSDINKLLPDQMPARRARVCRVSGGNPLYVQALAGVDDAVLNALDLPPEVGPDHLPPGLPSVLGTELDALGETERGVAHALAVAGGAADLDILVSVADRCVADVAAAIDELVARGIVRARGSRFFFRHPLVRAAAYQSAGPAWRVQAHRRAEQHLRRNDAPIAARARHAAVVAGYGDHTSVDTLVEAATATLGNAAPATAAHWLRTALACLPEQDVQRRIELMLLLARSLNLSGELVASLEILHELSAQPTALRGLAIRYRVVTERLLGRLDGSRALLEAELRQGSITEGVRGALLIELAAVHLLGNDLTVGTDHALDAVSHGVRRQDRGQEAAGRTLVALAQVHGALSDAAREQVDDAASIVDSLADAELREHLHLVPVLAWVELQLQRFPEAERHVLRGADIARRSGRTAVLPYLSITEGVWATRVGQLDRALQCTDDAVEMSHLMGSAETLAMARTAALPAALWKHGPTTAAKLAESLLSDGRPASYWWAELADLALATVFLEADQPERALELLHGRLGTPSIALNAPQASGLTAIALLAVGNPDEAVAVAERGVGEADATGLAYISGCAGLHLARVLAGVGRSAEAADRALSAVRSFGAAGTLVEGARAEHVAAEALGAAGDLPGARAAAGRAKALAAGSGATWVVSQIGRFETRLGAQAPRPGRTADGTAAGLSEREVQVAELVAEGMTNKEVGRKLYLSPKTVEAHLSRVYAKLGVRSRMELSKVLARSPR
jgi:DNA-binding NarL/FixJ family response regulator